MKTFIKSQAEPEQKLEIESKINQPVRRDKTSEVLKHLKVKGSITSLEAFNLYGATRLSAIIFNLRKRGYKIKSADGKCIDRYGHKCNFAKYVLEEDDND